jgi:RND family efflux transporter MFP subunit
MHIQKRCHVARVLVALLPVALLLLAGCSEPTTQRRAADPWVLVQPAAAPVDPARRALGTVRAARLHVLSTETGGRVLSLEVDIGDRVRRGQLLMVLDAEVASRRLVAARAEILRAEAQLEERARNNTRVTGLVTLGAASAADAEQAEIERQTAAATAAAARTALAAAERELTAVEIRAPIDGVVALRHIERSAVAAPGVPLLELDGDGPREIIAVAPESIARELRRGTRVTWRVGDTTGEAIVDRIGTRAGGSGARNVVVTVTNGALQPGSIAELAFPTGTSAATARVPAAAVLIARDGSRTLRVVDANQRVKEIRVALLRLVDGGALVAGPVRPGDQVVAAGGQHIAPGTRVQTRLAVR